MGKIRKIYVASSEALTIPAEFWDAFERRLYAGYTGSRFRFQGHDLRISKCYTTRRRFRSKLCVLIDNCYDGELGLVGHPRFEPISRIVWRKRTASLVLDYFVPFFPSEAALIKQLKSLNGLEAVNL